MSLSKEKKQSASEIIGVPGLKYKVDGKRYNAAWEEMEFVQSGVDGSADIWRVKLDLDPEPEPIEVPSAPKFEVRDEQESPSFNWNMRKDDIMAELEKRDIVFDPAKNRRMLLKLLRDNV